MIVAVSLFTEEKASVCRLGITEILGKSLSRSRYFDYNWSLHLDLDKVCGPAGEFSMLYP